MDSLLADRYRISRILGSGGMAEVYLALDCRLDREVALKVLPHRHACDPESVERFRREAGAAARLNHPNIVQVYDWGEAAGTYFIAMEYVAGRSLKEVIRQEGPLPLDKVVSLSTQILEALAFVHAAGFVHRDIKPQNVMIDDRGRAKVTDLGIVRTVDTGGMTVKGSILGTAQYLSPEQAQGKTASPASDLYSVGAVMYEMATGRPPFTGDNPVAIALQHVGEQPVPPSTLRPGLPAPLEEAILRALAKSPDDRWPSAEQFAGALELLRQAGGSHKTAPEAVGTTPGPADSEMPVVERTQIRPGRPGAGTRRQHVPRSTKGARPKRRVLVWSLVALLCLLLAGGGAYGVVELFRAEAVAVPSLVGRTFADAETEAGMWGLKVEPGGPSEHSSEYALGRILRQQPEGGTSSKEGRTVYVWVSAGPVLVPVPALAGMTEQEAIDALDSLGLEATVTRRETAVEDPGEVYAQQPQAGMNVEEGSAVEITIAVAPPTTTTTSTTTTTTTTTPPTTEDSGSGWWPWNWFDSDSDDSSNPTLPAMTSTTGTPPATRPPRDRDQN